MVFRVVVVCIVLAGSYALFEIWRQYDFFHRILNPISEFTVMNDGGSTTIVDFINYECGACKTTAKLLLAQAKEDKDIRLVLRPVPYEGKEIERDVKMVLAAGIQGKFWEMHESIIDFEATPDDKFFKETAALYDIDYQKMLKDTEGMNVLDIMKSNASAAYSLGLKTTPAIMIGKSFYEPQEALTLPEVLRMIQFEKTGE